ncbi:unnamed protein product [Thlaspi arvense]|uniref:Uncharacterized protein n=1 Tax=Thlaspi arvense TaxID=13288 RepID=A0AAU9REJ7_THLAR|nr:unnamed protein product [Thlaspi arvense]
MAVERSDHFPPTTVGFFSNTAVHCLSLTVSVSAKVKMATASGGRAKYIIGALIGSFGISYLFDKLVADDKIFGGKFFQTLIIT